MPTRYYSSTAQATTLTTAIGTTDVSITVNSTAGFPAQTPFTLILGVDTAVQEIVDVTAAAGTTLTITRAVDGPAYAHAAGSAVHHGVSARDFTEFQQRMLPPGGTSGQVLGKSSATNYATAWIPASSSNNMADAWKGDWAAGTTYARGDLAVYAGNLFFATSNTTGTTPDLLPGDQQAILGPAATKSLGSTGTLHAGQIITPTQDLTITAMEYMWWSAITALTVTGGVASNTTGTAAPTWVAGASATNTFTLPAQSWLRFDFPAPVTLTAGTAYWLAVAASSVNASANASAAGALVAGSGMTVGNYRYGSSYSATNAASIRLYRPYFTPAWQAISKIPVV